MMKRLIGILLALVLCSACLAGLGEETEPVVEYVDIDNLIDASLLPKTTTVDMENTLHPDAVTELRTACVERVNQDGVTLALEVEVYFPKDSDEAWETMKAQIEEIVTSAIQGIGVDTASMAHVAADALNASLVNGRLTIEDTDSTSLKCVSATIPYYPVLKRGSNGTAAQTLQQRLIDMGFLDDTADGYYGDKTKEAVEELQKYVREQELAAGESNLSDAVTLTSVAQKTVEPVTEVTGVADAKLQAYLYSDAIEQATQAMDVGDKGINVRRLQRKLKKLGYTSGSVDGDYGSDTARAVKLFQRYNELSATGDADIATQRILFFGEAAFPKYETMRSGNSGSKVKELQLRLRVGGFMSGSVDGSYGTTTVTGVKNLQQYLIKTGTEYASYYDTPNGVADSLLQELFFDDSFPEQPQLDAGSSDSFNVVRLQRRLNMLGYYSGSLDGQFGSDTKAAVQDFQKRHKLTQSGSVDASTAAILFSADAKQALKPYMIGISIANQKVYIYAPDSNEKYTKLVRTMTCSTGKNDSTPRGTFTGGPTSEQWHCFKNFENCWAQYAYYVTGDIMIHSVLYDAKEGKLTKSSVRNLGSPASHGCIRLSVEDAKWIWQNCPKGTKIIIK